jgi:hypothetical protein
MIRSPYPPEKAPTLPLTSGSKSDNSPEMPMDILGKRDCQYNYHELNPVHPLHNPPIILVQSTEL